MTQELSNFGDNAVVTMQSNVTGAESVGIEGFYHVDDQCPEGFNRY